MKRSKWATVLIVPALIAPLAACGGGDGGSGSAPQEKKAEQPADLKGTWKSSENEGNYFQAKIESKTMTVSIVDSKQKSSSLYWAGTYTAPSKPGTHTWVSKNDTSKTGPSILGSPDPTKEFTYKDGKISYSMTIAGTTKTVELTKE
ncbi:hypothetical protein [Arthrobacter sp. UM1]|uniref:hypothetical protein n=1 Tax=Arthrobacter sp. UM1 TaxID=2766776 RepID=UPI001CF61DAB|nr:hypothetical protein [Arthrobacter sp. UM1]MCB4208915.1 hypothetical protein [Arthrobacter sp. UM1]